MPMKKKPNAKFEMVIVIPIKYNGGKVVETWNVIQTFIHAWIICSDKLFSHQTLLSLKKYFSFAWECGNTVMVWKVYSRVSYSGASFGCYFLYSFAKMIGDIMPLVYATQNSNEHNKSISTSAASSVVHIYYNIILISHMPR